MYSSPPDVRTLIAVAECLEEYVGSLGYYKKHGRDDGIGTGLIIAYDDCVISYKGMVYIDDWIDVIKNHSAALAIALHTRWPSPRGLRGRVEFVHPFRDCTGRILVMHNGYFPSKSAGMVLLRRGHTLLATEGDKFMDSEIIAHIIEECIGSALYCERYPTPSFFARCLQCTQQRLLKLSKSPGLFLAMLQSRKALFGFSQLPMKKGSVFAMWRKGRRIMITTYKDLSVYPNDDYRAMDERLRKIMQERGYKMVGVMKNNEVVVHDAAEGKLYRYSH